MGVATKKTEQPAHPLNSTSRERLSCGLRWDDLKTFLAAAEQGSLRAAAGKLGVTVNTVRARIERLEEKFQAQLLIRTPNGVTLTDSGRRLLSTAATMRTEFLRNGAPEGERLRKRGELCIGTSEALGSGWLTPRLLDLHNRLSPLTVTLLCDYDIIADRSDELDVGVAWHPPVNPNLVVSRLATVHFIPFATRQYLREMGVPKTPNDLLQHRYIEQVAPGVKSELLDQIVGVERPPGFIPIRTNSSLALFYAVASGAGIALMPTYAAAVTRKLVPIDLPIRLRFDLLYFYHAEARNSGPVRQAIDWLRDAFDPVRYPFFSADFVHPDEFAANGRTGNIVPLFERFIFDPPHAENG